MYKGGSNETECIIGQLHAVKITARARSMLGIMFRSLIDLRTFVLIKI